MSLRIQEPREQPMPPAEAAETVAPGRDPRLLLLVGVRVEHRIAGHTLKRLIAKRWREAGGESNHAVRISHGWRYYFCAGGSTGPNSKAANPPTRLWLPKSDGACECKKQRPTSHLNSEGGSETHLTARSSPPPGVGSYIKIESNTLFPKIETPLQSCLTALGRPPPKFRPPPY